MSEEEQKAEELWKKADKYVVITGNNDCTIDAYIAGYHECQKEHEWHYVKDGDLPKENEYIMIYSKLADNIAVGKRRCAGKIRKRCVYEWYFATYDGTYCLRDKDIIAWKEIVLPEENEKAKKISIEEQLEYAKTIIKDLLDNSDEYARQRAIDYLEEEKKP